MVTQVTIVKRIDAEVPSDRFSSRQQSRDQAARIAPVTHGVAVAVKVTWSPPAIVAVRV